MKVHYKVSFDPPAPAHDASPFDAMMDRWFTEGFSGGATLEDIQLRDSLKERFRVLVSGIQLARSLKGDPTQALTEEIAKLRTYIQQQQESLALYQQRHARDLARAEEQALRPHLMRLLPILDAILMMQADARRPDCDPQTVVLALDMIGDGIETQIPRS